MIGARQGSRIATLVERSTRYVVLVKLASRSADHVVQRLQRQLQHLPVEFCKTLTWDRGHEMAAHHAFTVATDIPVYFCDPQSPWQRGTNENTNGLLRQYEPPRVWRKLGYVCAGTRAVQAGAAANCSS